MDLSFCDGTAAASPPPFFFLILSTHFKEPDDTQFVFIQFSAPFYVGQFNLTELIKGAGGKLLWAHKMDFLLTFLQGRHLVLLRAYVVKSVLVPQHRCWLISVTSHCVYREGGGPDRFRGIGLVFWVSADCFIAEARWARWNCAPLPRGRPLPRACSVRACSTRLTMLHQTLSQ